MTNVTEASMGDEKLKPDQRRHRVTLSRRQKQYWGSFIIAALFGVLSGIYLSSVTPSKSSDLNIIDALSQAQISPSSAIIGSVIFALMLISVIVLQHKGMDEQEERAFLIANTVSWYFILIAIPIWWLLNHANLIMPEHGFIIFIFSLVINLAIWVWKKFF